LHIQKPNPDFPIVLKINLVAVLALKCKAGDKTRAAELFKKAANWNEDSLNYAFVRSKAMTAMPKATPN
jgi:hypothetical protein